MKRFIIISLLTIFAIPMFGCIWVDTHNYYLFRVCDSEDFRSRVNKITNDNWKAYLGSEEEYFYFDADKVAEAAQQKGDALMVSYVRQLERYMECVRLKEREQNEWQYPTPAELAEGTSSSDPGHPR